MVEHRFKYLIAAGLLAAPYYVVLISVLGMLEPGFSHLSKPMSILGGVPGWRGLVFNFGVAATGMLVIAFGIGIQRQLPRKISAKIGLGLLLIGGMGLVGAGYFHCNADCKNIFSEPDLTGRLHIITSLLAGMGSALAPLFYWAAMRGSKRWQALATPTLVLAISANVPGLTFWITIVTDFRLLAVEGLIQRLGFVVVLIWMFYIAMKMMQSIHREK